MTRGDARRLRVRLTKRAVDKPRCEIDRGRREHGRTRVTSGKTAVVWEGIGLPEEAARLGVESNDGAAEGGIGPRRSGSGNAGVDSVAREDGRAGHDPLRVRVHLGNPA